MKCKKYLEILWEICSEKKLTWRNFYTKQHQSWDFLFLCRIFHISRLASFWWFLNVSWQIDQQVSVFLSSPSLVHLKLHNCADWIEPPRPPCSLHVLRKQENWQSFGNPAGARRNIFWWKRLRHLRLKYSINWNNVQCSMSIRGKKSRLSQWEFYIMRQLCSLLHYILPPRKC